MPHLNTENGHRSRCVDSRCLGITRLHFSEGQVVRLEHKCVFSLISFNFRYFPHRLGQGNRREETMLSRLGINIVSKMSRSERQTGQVLLGTPSSQYSIPLLLSSHDTKQEQQNKCPHLVLRAWFRNSRQMLHFRSGTESGWRVGMSIFLLIKKMTFGDLKCKIRLPRISFENNTDRSKCLHYFNSNKENTADKKRQLHTLHPRKVIKTKKMVQQLSPPPSMNPELWQMDPPEYMFHCL